MTTDRFRLMVLALTGGAPPELPAPPGRKFGLAHAIGDADPGLTDLQRDIAAAAIWRSLATELQTTLPAAPARRVGVHPAGIGESTT